MDFHKLLVVLFVLFAVLCSVEGGKKKTKYTVSKKADLSDGFKSYKWDIWEKDQSDGYWGDFNGKPRRPYMWLIDHCRMNSKIGKHRGLTMVMNNKPCKDNRAACHDFIIASCHMRTIKAYGYGHFEAIMRASHPFKVPTMACFSTYINDPKHNEMDACFSDQRKMSAAFFNGNRKPGAKSDTRYGAFVKLKRRADKVMAKYSYTWLPGQIVWRINGKRVSKATAHESRIPWIAQAISLILRPYSTKFHGTARQEFLSVKHHPMAKKTRDLHDVADGGIQIEDLPAPTGSQVCAVINSIRIRNHLTPFVVDQGLNHIAAEQATHMARRKTITHHPELSHRPSVYKYYEAKRLAESVGSASGPVLVASIIRDWMSHDDQKFILGDYEHVGCAVSESSDGRIWFVAEYGSHNQTSSNKKFHFNTDGGFWGTHAPTEEDPYSFGYTPYNHTSSYDLCSSVACETNAAGTLVCKKSLKCPSGPATHQATCPGSCGYIFDGETTVNCGTCPSDSVCSAHKCVKNTCGQCPDNSVCENGVCSCPAGSVLKDSNCVRVPTLSKNDPKLLESYTFYGGKWEINHDRTDTFHDDGEWVHQDDLEVDETHHNETVEDDEVFTDMSGIVPYSEDYLNNKHMGNETEEAIPETDMSDHDFHVSIDDGMNGIQQTQATTSGLAIWLESHKANTHNSVMVLSVDIELDVGSKAAGLVFNFKDVQNYMFLKYSAGQIYLGSVVAGETQQKSIGEFSLPIQTWAELKVVMRGNVIECYVNNKLFTSASQSGPASGSVGVVSEGSAAFANLNLRSRATMILKATCPAKMNEFVDNLAWTLRVDPLQLNAACSSNGTIDMIVEGTMDYPAESIGRDLINFVNSGAESLADMQLTIAAATMVPDVVAEKAIAF